MLENFYLETHMRCTRSIHSSLLLKTDCTEKGHNTPEMMGIPLSSWDYLFHLQLPIFFSLLCLLFYLLDLAIFIILYDF